MIPDKATEREVRLQERNKKKTGDIVVAKSKQIGSEAKSQQIGSEAKTKKAATRDNGQSRVVKKGTSSPKKEAHHIGDGESSKDANGN